MPQLFSNGARSELASPITATSTSITLKDLGQLFPACNYAGSSVLSQTSTENWIKLVIQDDAGFEIVYCYMHEASTNVFSNLKRGQEGTTARVFAADSVVGLRPIGGDLQALVNQTKANTEALVAKADKTGDISGNAGTATKLKNPVAIGGVLFDGSAGINLPGVNNPGNQNTTGNAGTATKLQTARAIAVGGSTKNFDGTAPISFTLAEAGAAEAVHSHTEASTTVDGFMSAADKVKLNGIAAGAQVNVASNLSVGTRTATNLPLAISTGSGVNLPLATTALAGLMSAADKAKVDTSIADAPANGKSYARKDGTWVEATGGGKGSLFEYSWHNGPRSSIDSGCIPADGQVIQFADNPVVCQAIWAGKQNAVLDASWAANKNCWSRGDGATWVRVPNLNMADGSAKPFYLRGGPESLTGTWVGDASRNLTGTMLAAHGSLVTQNNGTSGVFTADLPVSYRNPIEVGSSYSRVTLDASRSVPTADENRVKSAYGVWTVRVFTEVTNTGAIDAAQLATQLGVVDAALQTLDAQLGFTIIYPNGGTEAAPATVAANTQYVLANPFLGKHVFCVAEVTTPSGVWVSTGWRSDASTVRGFAAYPRGTTEIVATVAANFIATPNPNESGGSYTQSDYPVFATAKTRIKVWTAKGIV